MEHTHPLSEVCEWEWLAPATREALQLAGEEARESQSIQIYPEHLLLGLLAINEGKLAELFQASNLNITQMRKKVQERFAQIPVESTTDDIFFSDEAQKCLRSAARLIVSNAPQSGVSKQVSPELLALNLLYHPRVQHMLAPAVTIVMHLHAQLLEHVEKPAFQQKEWRLLFSRTSRYEEQISLHYVTIGQDQRRILKSIESPNLRFRDTPDLSPINREILDIVAFLGNAHNSAQLSHGLLLLEQPGKQIKQTVRAMAGEAHVPLTTVFSPVLAEIWLQSADIEQSLNAIRELFLSLRLLSFGLIYFEDLDHLARIDERNQEQDLKSHFWPLFLEEVDKLLKQPGMVLIASTKAPETLPSEILISSRFGRGIVVETRRTLPSAPHHSPQVLSANKARQKPDPLPLFTCSSCRRRVLKHWHYCVYCGATVSRTCPQCGTAYPEIPDAQFCFHCGYGPT